jgi:hypothetical protein
MSSPWKDAFTVVGVCGMVILYGLVIGALVGTLVQWLIL